MLTKLLIIETNHNIQSFAYDKHGVLIYHIIDDNKISNLEAVYCARINSLNKKTKFAYIDYAPDLQGVVNLKNTNLQAGSYLLCQLMWQGEPPKMPKFSTEIKLLGKYVILLPYTTKHFFSKQLKSDVADISYKYKDIGMIFRGSINDIVDEGFIENEINFLIRQFNVLKTASNSSIEQLIKPIYKFMQLLREAKLLSTIQIFTNNQTIFDYLLPYLDLWQLDTISLDESLVVDKPLKDKKLLRNSSELGLEIHKLSGINLIDINSKNSLLNFYQTNSLAIDEIVRQIWLRDLTGIILLDFIKNMSKEEEQKLIIKLNNRLNNDWRKIQVLGFTKAGICEIIRNK